MNRAASHHSRPISPPSRRAPWGFAPAVLALAALAAWTPLHAASRQARSSSQSDEQEFSPYRASQDVDVGKFYLGKGRYDAAISRFLGAAKHDPAWAVPHLYLGEAYEKKNDPKQAIAEYRQYLKIRPYAKDAKKIEKRIEKLDRELRQQNAPAQ